MFLNELVSFVLIDQTGNQLKMSVTPLTCDIVEGSGTRDPGPGTRDPGSGTRDQGKIGTRDPGPGTR